MRRIAATLRWEITLQWRNGFYYAVAFVLAFWVVLFLLLSYPDLSAILPGLLLANLEVTTFYFVAGLVMLEKEEGSLEARVVTPLRGREYLLVKAVSLALLALAENLVVAALFSRLRFNIWPLALGLLLAGILFVLYGFLCAVRHDSINEYLMPSVLYTLPLMLPLLDFFGLLRSPLFYLHPVQPILVLLSGAFRPLTAWEWLYGLGYTALWLVVLFRLCHRAFDRFVVARQGVK